VLVDAIVVDWNNRDLLPRVRPALVARDRTVLSGRRTAGNLPAIGFSGDSLILVERRWVVLFIVVMLFSFAFLNLQQTKRTPSIIYLFTSFLEKQTGVQKT
jgi:hypothetical protein